MERRASKIEILRLVTPVLVSLCLAILGAMWRNIDDIGQSVVTLKIDVAVLKEKSDHNSINENYHVR